PTLGFLCASFTQMSSETVNVPRMTSFSSSDLSHASNGTQRQSPKGVPDCRRSVMCETGPGDGSGVGCIAASSVGGDDCTIASSVDGSDCTTSSSVGGGDCTASSVGGND
ncbi:hypothetical protein Vafri_10643, partial [Volvox africanus]